MNNEYIIINKTAIEKRIKELIYEKYQSISREHILTLDTQIEVLKQIMSQSIPLIPEIEKSYDAGSYNHHSQHTEKYDGQKKDHISNLKLDI